MWVSDPRTHNLTLPLHRFRGDGWRLCPHGSLRPPAVCQSSACEQSTFIFGLRSREVRQLPRIVLDIDVG